MIYDSLQLCLALEVRDHCCLVPRALAFNAPAA